MDELEENDELDDDEDDDEVGRGVVDDDEDDVVDDGSLSISIFLLSFDDDFDRRKDLRLKSRNELNSMNDEGKKLNDRFV